MSEFVDFDGVLVDSHCHLDCLEGVKFASDLAPYIERAKAHGIHGMLCISIHLDTWTNMMQIIEPYDAIWATVGMHPNEAPGETVSVDELMSKAEHPRVVGIGETGLDFYRTEGDLKWQYERFENHLKVAKAKDLPVVVHCRDAFDETYQVLKNAGHNKVIIHCFTGNRAQAEQFLSLDGTMISISGIVTFKNAKALQEAVSIIPKERLLVETDAPYLAPMPYRGKSNEPAYTYFVARKVAALQQMTLESLAKQTTTNFERLFGIRVCK